MMIFSIMRSRHFQGYARMTSLIQPKRMDRNKDFGSDGTKWGSSFTLSWERMYVLCMNVASTFGIQRVFV